MSLCINYDFFPHPSFTPQTLLAADLALLKDGSVTPGLEFVEMMKLFFLGLLGKGWAVTFGTKAKGLGVAFAGTALKEL